MRPLRTVALVAVALMALGGCTVEGSESSIDTSQPAPVDLLHQRGKLARAIRDIERTIGADPARLTTVDVYQQYVIVEAQDPRNLDHIDRYTWRDGTVEPREPVHLSGPQEDTDAKLYPSTAVRWSDLARYVRSAERQTRRAQPIAIERPRASYVDVARSTSPEDDGRIQIQVSISGPRRSGAVILTAAGEITSIQVY